MTCLEYEYALSARDKGHALNNETLERVQAHVATCVRHGGTIPRREELEEIFIGMFARVGHWDSCKDPVCKHDDDPPSYFESETVRKYRKEVK